MPIFLKIADEKGKFLVQGAAKFSSYLRWIELLRFDPVAVRPLLHGGGGRASGAEREDGEANLVTSDWAIGTKLAQFAVSGTNFSAIVHLLKGGTASPYAIFTLSDVIVAGVRPWTAASADAHYGITLSYGKMTSEYIAPDTPE